MPAFITPLIPRSLAILIIFFLAGCGTGEQDKNTSAKPALKRASAYVGQRQYKAAIIEIRNAIRIAPDSTEVILLASRVNLDIGNIRGAQTMLEPLKDTVNPDIRLLLAETYLKKGKFRSALAILENTTEILSDTQKLTKETLTFKISLGQGKYTEAAQALKKIEQLSKTPESISEHAFLTASLLYKQNKPKETQAALQKTLSLNKAHTDALLMKAAIAYQSNNLEESDNTLSDALLSLEDTDIMLPKKSQILRALIDVLSSMGRSSEALIYTKMLTQNNPQGAERQSKLQEAMDLYKEGEYEKAEVILLGINEIAPNVPSSRLLGLLNLRKGNLEEAETFLSEGFDAETANNKTLSVLARTQLGLRQPDKVVAMLKEEIKVRGDDPELLALYGLAALASGNEADGVKSLQLALKISPKRHRLRLALADYHRQRNQPQLALDQLEEAYKIAPDTKEIQERLLQQYISMKTYKTKPLFYNALKAKPSDSTLNYSVGVLELKDGNNAKATKLLEKSVASDSNNNGAVMALGIVYLKSNLHAKAEPLFIKAIAQEPEQSKAYKGLAESLHQQKKEIKPIILALAKKHPTSSGPYEILSEINLKNNKIDDALKDAITGYEINKNPESRNQLLKTRNIKSKNALSVNNLKEARNQLIEALKIVPNSLYFLVDLVGIEIKDKNFSEADKVIAQIENEAPESVVTYILRADLAKAEGKPAEALSHAKNAWNKKPSNLIGRKIFALLQPSNKTEAAEFVDTWISTLPKSAEPYRLKGSTLLSNGDQGGAAKLFEDAIKNNENDVISLNNLAWIKGEQGDLKGAIKHAAKAYKLAENSAAVSDTYAWLLSQDKQFKKALPILEKAASLAPNDKEIAKHLEVTKNKVK